VIVANNGIGELCDAILGDVRSSKVSEILRDKIVMQCCKSAVKAGQKLPSGEIRALVRDITNGTGATTCPHGRPFIKSFTKTEIEKMFARK
jgi:DNA mismatch repair protein MutL